MLVVPLLALIGVGLLLFVVARASAGDASVDRKRVEQLIDLAVRDPRAATQLLREHPELLGARYLHDETPLHYCAVEGLADGVRFFVKAGVPVDAANEFGDTPLMDAVTLGNLEVVRLLLRHGADPNATSRTRESVLHDAVAHGHVEVVEALLDAGARADDVTSAGDTIGEAAAKARGRREELVKLLERHAVGRRASP